MIEEELIGSLATQFAEDGFCVLENCMDGEMVSNWKDFSLSSFQEVSNLISTEGETLGVGIKHGYKEIVQRHTLRYEMPFGANDPMFDIILENKALMSLVRKSLQSEDIIIANRSFVISQPGADVQGWHSDGPHVSVNEYLPCHVLNVFIPLVDIDERNGPTEFRPGSQKYTNNLAKGLLLSLAKKRNKPIQAPYIKLGSALLFDYRVLHRGGANKSTEPRPVLVFTFARNWYRDNLNFPSRSIVEIAQKHKEETTEIHTSISS